MIIYTAHYRYKGGDRLDITAKGNTLPGSILAPTWDMVKGYKNGTIDQWNYTVKYFSLLVRRMHHMGDTNRLALDEIIAMQPTLTLVCFCAPFEFCHRILAAQLLEKMGHGKYMGERQVF